MASLGHGPAGQESAAHRVLKVNEDWITEKRQERQAVMDRMAILEEELADLRRAADILGRIIDGMEAADDRPKAAPGGYDLETLPADSRLRR